MSFLDDVSVLILTYNEAPNIARTLAALSAFPEIVVLDSFSTDETRMSVECATNARLVQRRFDTHAGQWNHGLVACGLSTPWVLALDADHLVPAQLVAEIARLAPPPAVAGYRIAVRYCVHGRPLSAALYPPVVALVRRDRAHYVQTGHTQRAIVDGAIADLVNRIDHDDRKPLSRWLQSQQTYARLEAEHLLALPRAELRWSDRIRRMAWPAPILVFVYTLLAKRCLLDGWPGWLYVLQRTLAETLIALEIVDRRLGHRRQK